MTNSLRPARAAWLAACLLVLAAPAAQAQDRSLFSTASTASTGFEGLAASPPAPAPAPAQVRRVDVAFGRSTVVDLPSAARDAYVANPGIANAVVQTARRLYVTGIGEGATTIIVSNAQGQQIALIEVRVARDTGALSDALRAALPEAKVTARFSGANVVLSGVVASALEATLAADIAGGFLPPEGKVVNALALRGKEQVMLRVTVAEIQRNVLKQLGINADGAWKIGDVAVAALMNNPYGVAGQALTNSFVSIGNSDGVATLRAMEQAGVARTLAEPNLTAISGETATFMAGGEVPIPTGITCSTTNVCQPSIEFKKFGVSLTFSPVVLSAGRISLRVATEVSEVDPNSRLVVPAAGNQSLTIPGFRLRKSETTVELPSGGTLVTAGLIQENGRQAITGIPGAMEIPVLGTLFRSRDYMRQETELMILVTPILARAVAAPQAARPTDGFADAPDIRGNFLGQVNRVTGRDAPAVLRETATPALPNAPPPPAAFYGHTGFIID
ncbi:type II and III secretion system protein family protein [Aquabacter spiritensis]|uniref:Pilus assembly protein CpaC n=1 Tax=Aquabacter spiritensis TaxID=933073 RepID=A0A4R3M5H8_9HYPH|nr:type II and III secretion system protein family protein [Aquabacter spiritensis]TCT07509.1 pilus assembly protein CpaC [Aquabacter spiritensis]